VRLLYVTTYTDYFLNIISASKLGLGESPKLNIASLLKGVFIFNLDNLNYLRAALSKVKVILLEVYLKDTYFIGSSFAWDWARKIELGLDNWILTKGQFYRGVNYTLNLGNGLPKDILKEVVNRKLGIAYSQRWPWQRKDHIRILIFPLAKRLEFSRDGYKLYGRILGKYASTYAKVAAFDSIIEFNSQSRVDKLSAQDKKQQRLQLANVANKKRIYTQLYDKNLYILAYEMLNNKSCKVIVTGKELLTIKEIFGCSLLLYPNILGKEIKLSDILEIIGKIKEGNYKFTDLSLKGGPKELGILKDFSVNKDILLIKAIIILLESIYASDFNSLPLDFRPRAFSSFTSANTREFALRELKFRLIGIK
jgi:hypothetical protein